MKKQKLAIVSDQICGGIGGAESILFRAIDLFPDTPVYTTIFNPEIIPEKYKNIKFITSFIYTPQLYLRLSDLLLCLYFFCFVVRLSLTFVFY